MGFLHNGNKSQLQKRVGGRIVLHLRKYKWRSVPERMEDSIQFFLISSPLFSPFWPQGGAFLCGPVPIRRAERQEDYSRLPRGSQSPTGPSDDIQLWRRWKGQQWGWHPGVPRANVWATWGRPAVPQTRSLLSHLPPSRNLPGGQDREGPAGRDCPLHWALHEELWFCQGREERPFWRLIVYSLFQQTIKNVFNMCGLMLILMLV